MLAQLYPKKIADSISKEKIKKMKALAHYRPIKYSMKRISSHQSKNSDCFPADYGTKAGENSRKIELLNLKRKHKLDKNKVVLKAEQFLSNGYSGRFFTQNDSPYHLGRSVYHERSQIDQLKQERRSEQFINIISKERLLHRQRLKDRCKIINQQQRIAFQKEFEKMEVQFIRQLHQPRKKSLALQKLRNPLKKDEDKEKGQLNESHLSRHFFYPSPREQASSKQIECLREYIKKSNEAKKVSERYQEEDSVPQSSFKFKMLGKFHLKTRKRC